MRRAEKSKAKMKRDIRSTVDRNGKRFGLGAVVSFEERRWRVVEIFKSGRVCAVKLQEAIADQYSSVSVYAGEVLA